MPAVKQLKLAGSKSVEINPTGEAAAADQYP